MSAMLARLNAIFIVLTALIPLVFGSDPKPINRDIYDDFLVAKWTTSQGLPQNTVTSIVQTRDGYIWVGTFGGLARFDGVRFTTFDSTNTPGFAANRILSLFEDSRGYLWIGTDSGEVYVIADGKLSAFAFGSAANRRQVWAISEDGTGNMFVSTSGGIETFRIADNGEVDISSFKVLIVIDSFGLFRDANSRVWAKVDTGIVLLSENSVVSAEELGIKLPPSVFDMSFDRKGTAIVGSARSLGTIHEGSYSEVIELDPKIHRYGFAVAAIDDSFWFQQASELITIDRSGVVIYDLTKIARLGSRAIMRDSEGDIWLATQADGLVRLKRRTIRSVASMLKMETVNIFAVTQDRKGSIWLAGSPLYKIDGDSISSFNKRSDGEIFPLLQTLAVDGNDQVWAGGQNGLFRLAGNSLVPIDSFRNDHVQALYFDRDNALWVGMENGLARLYQDRIERFNTEEGLVSPNVHFITQTGDGKVWIGTSRGISGYINGAFENLSAADGLPNEYVRDIVELSNGDVWLATYGGGIVRYRNGTFASVTRSNGLLNNFVSRLIVDDTEHFWMLTNLGVFCTSRDELDHVADGSTRLLGGAKYDVSDGMDTSEANGGHQTAGILAADGRLWFPMITDVVSIDPSKFGHSPPGIVIENATSRGGSDERIDRPLRFAVNDVFEIVSGPRNLQIEYTGLSYSKPEAVRFVYRLKGLDEQWFDAGPRRTVFYPFLPVGDYTFEVRAQNANGVWSTETATLSIRVAPRFYETWWFAAAALLLATLVIGYIYYSKLRSLNAKRLEQIRFSRELIKAGEAERARIAKELHDGLSQNLLVIKNWGRTAQESSDGAGTKAKDYLAKAVSLASSSLDETRAIIENLVPQNLSRFGLTETIRNLTEQAEDAFGISFETDIVNIDGLFDDETQLSVYRIIQEAISNIVKHSESPRAVIRINKLPGLLILSVRDFGVGMDHDEMSAGDDRGFGLRNMRERLKMIGGSVTFSSPADSGTEVTIRIPIEDEKEDKSTDR